MKVGKFKKPELRVWLQNAGMGEYVYQPFEVDDAEVARLATEAQRQHPDEGPRVIWARGVGRALTRKLFPKKESKEAVCGPRERTRILSPATWGWGWGRVLDWGLRIAVVAILLLIFLLGVPLRGNAQSRSLRVQWQDEGSVLGTRGGGNLWIIDCTGAGIACTQAGATITVNVTGGGATGYQTIEDEGTPLTQRTVVNFIGGGVSCVDNGAGLQTDCTVTAGAGATHQIDGVALTAQDPINVLDTSVFDWTNPAAGNLSLAIKAASLADSLMASSYSGVGSCTNQLVRATVDDAAPTCETVVAADKDLTEAQTWTGLVTFVPSGLGGLANFDIQIGDTDGTPTYGIARFGDSFGGRTSFISGSLDLDGAVLIVNQGGPVTSDIEFAWMESSSVVRFAIAGAGAGLGTYSPRSLIVAGPAPANSNMVNCDTWTTNNANIDCDTSATGADLFVQDDLEVEGLAYLWEGIAFQGTPAVLTGEMDAGGATSFEVPNSAAPTVDAFGEIAGDDDFYAASRGVLTTFDGTSAVHLVAVLNTSAPSSGQVPTFVTGGTVTWQTPSGSGDVTAVGPGCADGECWIDGTVTTGTVLLVWEGTGLDANEFTINVPLNPGADISWTVPDAAAAVTFPSGTVTLATLSNNLGDFGGTTSAQLRAELSDNEGDDGGILSAAFTSPAVNDVVCIDGVSPTSLGNCTLNILLANEGATGTTVDHLASLTGAPSTAIITSSGATGGSVGVVIAGAGTTGNAELQVTGIAQCDFDGATTAGNYVQISNSVAGECTDAGSTYPSTEQVIGLVTQTIGAAGLANVMLFAPENRDADSGGTHAILSATHSDTTPAAVTRGGQMIGVGATPAWALVTIGGANTIWGSDGTDPSWEAATGTASPVRANNPLFPDRVRFTAIAAPAHSAGQLFYDSSDESLVFHNNESDIALQIGQEGWVRVRNESGTTITNGKVVYIDGIASGLPSIALAKADALSTSQAVGFVTHDIEDLSNGFVTLYGVVRDIDTTGLTDDVYLSAATAGEMVDSPPSDPDFVVPLGIIVETGVTGDVFVNVVGPRSTGGAGIVVSGNSIAVDLNATADGVGLASSLSGMEFTATGELALLQGCIDNDIPKWTESTSLWGCAADVSGGSPSLNTITAAVGTTTINSGDNAIVWNWSLTTAGKIAFKIGENVASVATTDPILFNIATLAASTAHPFQVTSRGEVNGLRVGATDGILIDLGTGGVDFGALLNYPTACSATFVRAILDSPTCEAVATADIVVNAADNTIIRDSAGFSVIGKSTTGSGDPADIVAADETVLGRTGAGNLVFAQIATGQVANDAVTDTKLRNSAGFSVIGKTATGSGDPADIAAADETVLGRTAAGNLVFAALATGQVTDNAITFPKMQDIATDRLIGRDTAASGDPEELTVGGGLSFTGSGGIQCDVASTTAVGCPEMAIASEVDTGTSTILAVTPDALAGSTLGQAEVEMTLFDFTTAVTTGDGKYFFHIAEGSKLIGMDLISLTAAVITVSSSGLPTVDVARCAPVATGNPCSGTIVDVLTTDLTIDVNEDSSFTATTAFAINTANDDVVEDGMWRIDVDIAGTGTQGLIVTLIFQKP